MQSHRRPLLVAATLAVALSTLVVALRAPCGTPAERSRASARPARAPASGPRARQGPGMRDPGAGEARDTAGEAREEGLIARLRRIGSAYEALDGTALARELDLLLADESRAHATLELLRAGTLRGEATELHGALVAVQTAIAVYNGAGSLGAADGRGFVRALLEALPHLGEPERGLLMLALCEARVDGRAVLDISYLRHVLDLRLVHPDLAGELSLLFTHMAEGLEGQAGFEEFYALLVTELDDPVAVKVSLSALLRSGATTYLRLAEELYREADEEELREAILQAVAASADVDAAADVLSRLAEPRHLPQMLTLGARVGSSEALTEEYERLVAVGDSSPRARRALVSALSAADPETLLRIEASDPHADVRGQALLTLTSSHPPTGEVLERLRAGLASHGAQGGGLSPGVAALAAENVLAAGAGEVRTGAREFLVELASDGRWPAHARRLALEALARHAPGAIPAALEIEDDAGD